MRASGLTRETQNGRRTQSDTRSRCTYARLRRIYHAFHPRSALWAGTEAPPNAVQKRDAFPISVPPCAPLHGPALLRRRTRFRNEMRF